jgi:hypothetical protein
MCGIVLPPGLFLCGPFGTGSVPSTPSATTGTGAQAEVNYAYSDRSTKFNTLRPLNHALAMWQSNIANVQWSTI